MTPYFNRSKFGDRINDAARMLRKSWDKYNELNGANQSGQATKLIYGLSCLKQNNYVRFDKQTSRENYQVDPSSKAHPARFVYMAQSEFTRPNRR